MSTVVGVLALQGDVREHLAAIDAAGGEGITVRRVGELTSVDALVLPGGESTAMWKLMRSFDMLEPLRERIAEGMPTYGSCAGMILLANEILDAVEGQENLGGLDVTVRRNAFGRQIDSFETDLAVPVCGSESMRAVFIRAPWIERVGPGVEVLASVDRLGENHPVAVRQGHLLATSFHPEITNDMRVHRFFLQEVCK